MWEYPSDRNGDDNGETGFAVLDAADVFRGVRYRHEPEREYNVLVFRIDRTVCVLVSHQ